MDRYCEVRPTGVSTRFPEPGSMACGDAAPEREAQSHAGNGDGLAEVDHNATIQSEVVSVVGRTEPRDARCFEDVCTCEPT